jgi:hypothetical protein
MKINRVQVGSKALLIITSSCLLGLVISNVGAAHVSAFSPPINQGTTSTYGVLAATTVTNTGATTLTGTAGSDLGLSPGTSFTNTGTFTHIGAENIANAAAVTAKNDLTTAYNDLSIPTAVTLANLDLGGQTLTPGAYMSGSSLSNSTNLTFNALGDPNAVFILKAVSTVITSSASTMTLINGAQACNIYWQVGSSATLGTNSTFIGHIYASTSIAATTGATIYGQLLASTGAVTLDTNTIVSNSCTAAAVTTTSTGAPTVATTAPVSTQAPSFPITGTNSPRLLLIASLLVILSLGVIVFRRRLN